MIVGTKKTISRKVFPNTDSLIKSAKKKGLIKSHKIAFKVFPVKEEKHKGKVSYFNK